MKTPFSKYEILGRVAETVSNMPTDTQLLQMCNTLADCIYQYLQELEIPTPVTLGKPAVVKAPTTDIFDTEHTDDIPVDIKPKKAKYEKELPGTMPIQVNKDGLPIPEILWREKPFNLDKCYLGKYSNPCSASLGKCHQPCVQTELWLYDKKTDYLTVVDVEFADLETLHRSLDPWVEYAKKHHTQPEYLDAAINDAMDDLAAAAKEIRTYRKEQDEQLNKPKVPNGKTRLEYYVELYKAGFKVSQIAREMGINKQYVYNLKNQAKNKGLLP